MLFLLPFPPPAVEEVRHPRASPQTATAKAGRGEVASYPSDETREYTTKWYSYNVGGKVAYVTEALWIKSVGFVGKAYPSHPFCNAPSYGLRNFSGNPNKTTLLTEEISADEKIDVCKTKGLIVRPVVWEHSCGIFEGSHRVPPESSQWEFPGVGVDG